MSEWQRPTGEELFETPVPAMKNIDFLAVKEDKEFIIKATFDLQNRRDDLNFIRKITGSLRRLKSNTLRIDISVRPRTSVSSSEIHILSCEKCGRTYSSHNIVAEELVAHAHDC